MHAVAITLLCWAMIAAAWLAPPAATAAAPWLLASLVACVGLPHGAADHRLAGEVLAAPFGRAWPLVFLAAYLGVAAITLAGWFVAPLATILLFFAASAWHFGREEPRLIRLAGASVELIRLARGGLVIWIPVLVRRGEVALILRSICPTEAATQVDLAMAILTPISGAMAATAAALLLGQVVTAIPATRLRRRVLVLDASLAASLAVVFAAFPPLISFPVYFCAWHSARGLRRLRRVLGETWRQLAVGLAPMTLASVALLAAGAVFVWRSPDLPTSLVRTTFLGLSAVAMPHLLLEALLARFAKRRMPAEHHTPALGGLA